MSNYYCFLGQTASHCLCAVVVLAGLGHLLLHLLEHGGEVRAVLQGRRGRKT